MAEISSKVTVDQEENTLGKKLLHVALHNSVTLLFLIICIGGIIVSELPMYFIANELLTRLTRNTFLVLALIIPVMAGMGLNFSIVVGAMAGQIAIIMVTYWGIGGPFGLVLCFIISAPIAILFGKLTGILLNRTKGQEMIASMIVGYFANGIYQLVFLFMAGTIIPMVGVAGEKMLLSSGMGLRNTIDLAKNGAGKVGIKYALDGATTSAFRVPFFLLVAIIAAGVAAFFIYRLQNKNHKYVSEANRNKDKINAGIAIFLALFGIVVMYFNGLLPKDFSNFYKLRIPIFTALVVMGLAVFNLIIVKTKLGQDFRTVGQDKHIAQVSGIRVNKVRELAIALSTLFAAWGQIIFLQNMGMLNTYGSHVQIALFAIAALLIGGASVSKATVGQAFLGVILFHTLFIVSPAAGKNLFGDAQIGEFFRAFVAYGVIGVSLGLHAWKKTMIRQTSS